jgi:uncharacterized membrane protein YfcA
MVPAMFYVFSGLGYHDTAMHMAVGTSLAIIVLTSVRSVMEHTKHGAVDYQVLKTWSPWIVLGALSGSFLADMAPGRALMGLYGVVGLPMAAQFFFGRQDWKLADNMPGLPWSGVLGGFIGVLSSMMGIGGGVFGVILMTLFGKSMHTAVATAAGFGVAIGLPAAIGFMIAGLDEVGRAPFSIGYVNMAAFAIMAGAGMFLTPIGARLAHRMDPARLRKAFAIGLTLMALNMLREAVFVG